MGERILVPMARLAVPASVAGVAPLVVLGTDEHLRVVAANSVAGVTIVALVRRQGMDGRVQYDKYTHTPATDRSVTTADFHLTAGALLSLSLFVEGATPQIGQTFVQASLVLGAGGATQLLGTLAQSYITARQPAVWPGTPLRQSWEGPGALVPVTSTGGFVGPTSILTCPTGARWRLRHMRGAYLNNGAAATRFLITSLISGAFAFETVAPGPQPAGATYSYLLQPGLPSADYGAATLRLIVGIPLELILRGGDTVSFGAIARNGADQVGDFSGIAEEWLEVA